MQGRVGELQDPQAHLLHQDMVNHLHILMSYFPELRGDKALNEQLRCSRRNNRDMTAMRTGPAPFWLAGEANSPQPERPFLLVEALFGEGSHAFQHADLLSLPKDVAGSLAALVGDYRLEVRGQRRVLRVQPLADEQQVLDRIQSALSRLGEWVADWTIEMVSGPAPGGSDAPNGSAGLMAQEAFAVYESWRDAGRNPDFGELRQALGPLFDTAERRAKFLDLGLSHAPRNPWTLGRINVDGNNDRGLVTLRILRMLENFQMDGLENQTALDVFMTALGEWANSQWHWERESSAGHVLNPTTWPRGLS